jgi:diketogulonate reductase-like aldo/keto reductase
MVLMKYKTLQGVKLPVLCIGSWTSLWNEKEGPKTIEDKQSCIDSIRYAIKLGITHIDTAELYGRGKSEEIIKEAIKDIERNSLFITSKVMGSHLGRDSIHKAIDGSLQRLGIDYLDLYLVHWPSSSDPAVPLSETMSAMCELVDSGKIKHIGVSNFSVEQMKEAQKYSKYPLLTNQVEYNVLARGQAKRGGPTSEILQYCKENNMFLTAYRPIMMKHPVTKKQVLIGGLEIPKLKMIFEKYKKTTTQIVLNWVLTQENVIAAFTSVSQKNIEENVGALDFELKAEDREYLENQFLKDAESYLKK